MKSRIIVVSLFVATFFTSINTVYAETSLSVDKTSTALLITDPQNDFLAESGVAYGLVKDSLKEVGTIAHIDSLFNAAKESNMAVFVSPHIYFPHDNKWEHRGALQKTIHEINMFHVDQANTQIKLEGTGADFLQQYKKYIYDGETTITSPHKIYGPESNDLVLQLRKQGIQTVIVGGMAANLCTDSHMRELVEQGFEVIMVNDAVGAPGKAAYNAALTNYDLIAHAVITTEDAVQLIRK